MSTYEKFKKSGEVNPAALPQMVSDVRRTRVLPCTEPSGFSDSLKSSDSLGLGQDLGLGVNKADDVVMQIDPWLKPDSKLYHLSDEQIRAEEWELHEEIVAKKWRKDLKDEIK